MFEVEAGADEKQQIKFVWPNISKGVEKTGTFGQLVEGRNENGEVLVFLALIHLSLSNYLQDRVVVNRARVSSLPKRRQCVIIRS